MPVSDGEELRENGLEARHLQLLDRLLADGRTGDALDLPNALTARLGYETLRFERRDEPHAAPVAQTTSYGR